LDEQQWIFTIKGACAHGQTLKYLAAAPSDIRQSRAGSGLPFPNPKIAYDNTPNKGEVQIRDGQFEFQLVYPAAYYIENGSTLVAPHVHFTVDDGEYFDVKLGPCRFPNRSLKHLPGRARRTTGR
jgi:hypothetical protein